MPETREPMSMVRESFKVEWYRCPVAPDKLKELTRRSDTKGALQAVGYLLVVAGLGALSWLLYRRGLWGAMAVALFLFGLAYSFTPGLVTHELSHGTVFRTKWLNGLFLRFYSLVGWTHFHQYKRSHTYHHLYTLHPRGDREVVLPTTPSLHPLRLLMYFTLNVENLGRALWGTLWLALTGRFWNDWSEDVFADDRRARGQARAWAWLLLAYHAAVIAVGVALKLWLLPVLLTLGPYIANIWMYLVGLPMHAGLRDNVPDFRLCCRTITLDPISGFLYWHMNYHTEHHMYAAVPCYNLGKLARAMADDMPKPRSVLGAWKEMRAIYRRQRTEPGYQYDTPLPVPRGKAPDPHDALRASIGDLAPRALS